MGNDKHDASTLTTASSKVPATDATADDGAPAAVEKDVTSSSQKDALSESKQDDDKDQPETTKEVVEDSATAPSQDDADKKSSPVPPDSHDEGLSRKRDREGSVEPSFAAAKAASGDAIPAKKNRILSTSSSADKTAATGDNEKVGQIRQRVEELSYDERQPKRTDTGAKRSVSPAPPAKSADVDAKPAAGSSTSKEAESSAAPKSTSPTPVRTQPTFSSFSSSASPFSSAIAGVSGPSWLAGSSSSSSSSPLFGNGKARSGGMSGTTGAIKPSALGGGGDEAGASTSTSTAEGTASPSPKPAPASGSSTPAPTKGPSLGFGAFAGARPFTKAAGAASSSSSTGGEQTKATEKPEGSKNIFDKADQADDGASPSVDAADGAEADASKVKVQKIDDEQLTTGEENERTVHSVRCKLYAMNKDGEDGTAIDGTWKERGTGTVRVNVPLNYMRHPKGHGSRLVMRSEGVLRLILNVALFHGMKVELAGEKFVRFVALEEAKLIHFALKVPNPVAAASLYRAITSHIPTSPSETSTPSREPAPAVSKATGYVMKEEEPAQDGDEARSDVEAQGGDSASEEEA